MSAKAGERLMETEPVENPQPLPPSHQFIGGFPNGHKAVFVECPVKVAVGDAVAQLCVVAVPEVADPRQVFSPGERGTNSPAVNYFTPTFLRPMAAFAFCCNEPGTIACELRH